MSFAQKRERRANAGSRMRALLDQEEEMEELFEESVSDDEEFITKPEDEVQDTVDSDFDTESSDEEREQEELGRQVDKQIAIEERQARRAPPPPAAIQSRAPKRRQPKTKPAATEQQQQQQQRRRRSEVDAVRQSSRANTVRNRLQVEEQIREYKSRRAQLPKRDRPAVKQLTQEELLAEAVITERENRESLELWQQKETERRAKMKKKDKKRIVGPFVRYASFTEDPDKRPKRRKIIMISVSDENGENNVHTEITDPLTLAWQEKRDMEQSEAVGRNLISFMQTGDEEQQSSRRLVNLTGLSDRDMDRTDLVPELAAWAERPTRPAKPTMCPITGLPARYLDPKTMVPYANLEAYKTIQKTLHNKAVWSSDYKVYVGEPSAGANGVPEGWQRAISGKREGQVDWQRSNGDVECPDWFNEMHNTLSFPNPN
ncbi:YL1 nuclear protein-domain-containing protein [Zychaea mexicana]|uniref:YL1 nuclear protein-domain-containing protein n=1 Tax=Zychaea mexicana TaxID=64656 RepID=UPI0022FE5C67|nr:YL1 nuclear protein-domain-containing protein [Zychaea mexicana]KAI9499399.1 YL1 nuclear protein-domain-containing protein [Zychaea mexicana]